MKPEMPYDSWLCARPVLVHRGPIERAYRDARAAVAMGPSNVSARDWIGKALVGLPLELFYEGENKSNGAALPRSGGRARLATSYDRLAANYLAFVQLASIRLWLRRGLVRRHGFCQAVAECPRYAVIAPVILVQPIAVEIADHLIKGDTTCVSAPNFAPRIASSEDVTFA